MRTTLAAAMVAVALIAAACGGGSRQGAGRPPGETPSGSGEFTPLLVSSELVVGENRVVVGLLDEDDAPAASPDIDLVIAPIGGDGEIGSGIRADFVWSRKPVLGVYVTHMTFPSAGTFQAAIQISRKGSDDDGVSETHPMTLQVAPEPTTPPLGSAPPAIETPTASGRARIETISTDPDPDPRFYRYSVDEALKLGEPLVVAFATPKFCTSQVCGPTLDSVKAVSKKFPGVNFVHVEPYELPADPSDLRLVEPAERWGLPSEPYVFAIDRSGRVAAKYEGVVGAEELTEDLRKIMRRG